VSWSVDGKPCGTGTTIRVILGRELLGKWVRVKATAGASSEEAEIAVPELILEGPDKVEIRKEIDISARVQPAIAGTYVWLDQTGKQVGTGPRLTFKGKVRSDRPGDQPVECRFTSSETGNVYTEKHPITVEDKPSLILPINLTIKELDATTRWLAANPIEVRIDDVVVAAHTMVERAGRVVVSFRIEPGDHDLVITSGPAEAPPNRPRIRVVHFSSRVKITEDRTALAETGKRTDGKEQATGDPDAKLGRGFSPKLPLRVIKPKDPKEPKK
jgi:hypothetical protein